LVDSPAEQLYTRARRLWCWALLSPVAYLALGVLLQAWSMLSAPPPLDFVRCWSLPFARLYCAGLLAGLLTVWGLGLWRATGSPGVELWWRRFLWCLMLADTLACAGLVSWYLTQRAEPFLLGGLAAYLAYAAVHPRRREVDALF
jgi:hypothetical protein